MHWILWIFVGMVVGTLAKRTIPGETPGNLFTGVTGALAAGALCQTLLQPSYSGWIWSTLAAFVGAAIALFLFRLVSVRPTA